MGFELLTSYVCYPRDYLIPKLKSNGELGRSMETPGSHCRDLSKIGLVSVVQGYWTEHSERAVLPKRLSVLETPPVDKDILGRWKPEKSDTCACSYGGRVARLRFALLPLHVIRTIMMFWMSVTLLVGSGTG